MTERDKIARAIEDALKPLGYALHETAGGVKVLAEPLHDLFKVYIKPVKREH